jgi:hypothetical protein
MVRRRSAVRSRIGALTSSWTIFEQLERAAWNESRRRCSAPIAANAPIAQPKPGGSYRRQPPTGRPGDSLRVWAGRVTSEAQGADPPVHVARAQDVLQLNGAEGIARALRTCRIEGVASSYTYAPSCMPSMVTAIVNSALSYWGRADRVCTRFQRSRLNAVLARPDSAVGGAMPVDPGIGQFWLLLPSPAARNFWKRSNWCPAA